jgi:hypothetical protein
MSEQWVVNASPLILLGKTRHLDLLAALADTVVIPQVVAIEVGANPTSTIRPGILPFLAHCGPWLCCKCLSERGQVARKRL